MAAVWPGFYNQAGSRSGSNRPLPGLPSSGPGGMFAVFCLFEPIPGPPPLDASLGTQFSADMLVAFQDHLATLGYDREPSLGQELRYQL